MAAQTKAYSTLTIKGYEEDDDKMVIEGIASTPSVDREGDILEPKGAKYSLPMPLLWQHNHSQPIGLVDKVEVTKSGIKFRASFAKVTAPGTLKTRIDEAWQSVKAGLIRGVSVGFIVKAMEPIKDTYGFHIKEWDWMELSLVTIPAQVEATIQSVKSAAKMQALSGSKCVVAVDYKGVSASQIPIARKENTMSKNAGAQIDALMKTRKEKASELEAIQEKCTAEGRTKNADERSEFDKLREEIRVLDAEIADLRDLEEVAKGVLRPVIGDDPDSAQRSRSHSMPARAKRKEEPGVRLARLVKVRAVSRLEIEPMADVAERMYGRDSEVYAAVKAPVAPGTTVSGNWGAALIGDETSAFSDFVEFLRPQTIVGRFGTGGIPSLRATSFRSPLISQTGGGQGHWVGEAKPKPLTAFNFARETLEPLKVANIAVVSEEHIRDSSPNSELAIRDALVAALRETIDESFVNPINGGTPNVEPASITNLAPAIVAQSWNDADDVRLDIRALMKKFTDANNPLSSAVFIMSEVNATALMMMRSDLGVSEFPDMDSDTPRLNRRPVIVSDYVGDNVILVNASDIYFGDEGGFSVDLSREASLEMVDNPTQNPPAGVTGTSLVSLWQNNLVGLRAERTLSWKRRRDSAVAYLTDVEWGGPVPES